MKARKAAAWRPKQYLEVQTTKGIKQRIFTATVESVPLHGCEAWKITPKQSKYLDGCYTPLLRTVFNVNWKKHNKQSCMGTCLSEIEDCVLQDNAVRKNSYLGNL